MKRIEELRRQRADVIEQMKQVRAASVEAKRGMNSEETAKFDELDKKQEELRAEIEREEKMAGLEGEMAQAVTTRAVDAGATKATETKGFESFGDFLQAVHRASEPNGHTDPRLSNRAATGLGEQVPSDGGFLVQKDFLPELLKRVYSNGALASRCRRIPVTGNGIAINAVDETSRATGSRFGGVQGYWAGEADQKTASKPKFRRMEMQLQKLVGLCYSTDELLTDAAALGSVIEESFVDEFAFLLDDAILNGTGVGKPAGILNSGSLVTVAKESGQTADTVVLANIVKMRARLWARSRANAVWFYNQDIEPQLHQLTLVAGSANVAVYLPQGSIAGVPYDTIMGIPAMPIEQCATLGDVGDIVLADMSQYMLIEKGGIQKDMSMHVRFIYDESVFRFVLRVNGQPIWNAALTPYKGSNTQSPFVALADRA